MEITTKEETNSGLDYITSLDRLMGQILPGMEERQHYIKDATNVLKQRPKLKQLRTFHELRKVTKSIIKQYNDCVIVFNALSQEKMKVADAVLSWYLINEPEKTERINKLKLLCNEQKQLTFREINI